MQELSQPWWKLAIELALGLVSLAFLGCGLWLGWEALAKEPHGNDYRPISEILLRIATLIVTVLVLALMAIFIEGGCHAVWKAIGG